MTSGEQAKICLTIDAEGDAAENPRTTVFGIEFVIPILLEIFSRFGIRATFFVQEDLICRIGTRFRSLWKAVEDGGHEIGLHAHGLIEASDEKRETIVDTGLRSLEAAGFHPVSFRAGRYFVSGPFLRALERRGIMFDSSVVPGLMEKSRDGSVRCDHAGAPYEPYFPSYEDHRRKSDSGILEIPINRYPALEPFQNGFLTGQNRLEEVLFDYFLEVRKDRVIVVNIHPWDGLSVLWKRLVRGGGYGSPRSGLYRALAKALGSRSLLAAGYSNRINGFLNYIHLKGGVRFASIGETGNELIKDKEAKRNG